LDCPSRMLIEQEALSPGWAGTVERKIYLRNIGRYRAIYLSVASFRNQRDGNRYLLADLKW
jgi:hypothetical protein